MHLWVVNDSSTDKVFKYTLAGGLVGSWTISGGGGAPTGITLDPTSASDLWIVDNGTDRVYQYDNAAGLTSGSQAASTSFALAPGNTSPQDIADPPAPGTLATASPLNAERVLRLAIPWSPLPGVRRRDALISWSPRLPGLGRPAGATLRRPIGAQCTTSATADHVVSAPAPAAA